MEIKDQLPAFVLAELYGSFLVSADDGVKKNLTEVKQKKLYHGNYEKKIIVLVNDNVYADDGNLAFLSGILNACKLNMAHIALINFNDNVLNFHRLKKELRPEFLVSFGITALQIDLPFTLPDYQVQQYDSCKIFIAPALAELNLQTQQAKNEKAKLWKSLQKMFSLEK